MKQTWILLLQAIIAVNFVKMSAQDPVPHHRFEKNLFHQIVKTTPNQNVIISPFSIETCLAMGFFGASGKTAEEISTGLLGTTNKEDVAATYEKRLKDIDSTSMIKIANKIFANQNNEVKPEFNEIAAKVFKSEAQNLDFDKASESIKVINDWVESKTNNKIQKLLGSDSVNSDTSMILVNAIYFKGEWEKPFSSYATHQSDYWLSDTEKITTDMMMNDDDYKYGEFSEIDATAIEMPYKNSELSMMIILPNKRNGLQEMMEKFKSIYAMKFSESMTSQDVEVFLPKFKVEYSTSLVEVLKSMGMATMFSNGADFSNLFKSSVPVKVSDIVHKAFIDVNEAGSEAAAATFMKIVPMSLNMNKKRFVADHPFVFLIKDKSSVYFAGQVVKF